MTLAPLSEKRFSGKILPEPWVSLVVEGQGTVTTPSPHCQKCFNPWVLNPHHTRRPISPKGTTVLESAPGGGREGRWWGGRGPLHHSWLRGSHSMGSLSSSCVKNAQCGLDQASIWCSYLCPWVLILFRPYFNHSPFPGMGQASPAANSQYAGHLGKRKKTKKILIWLCPKANIRITVYSKT